MKDWRIDWRNKQEKVFTTDASTITERHDAVWPKNLQEAVAYTRAGKGDFAAGDVTDPNAEHKRTDFFSLKDFALDESSVLTFLADCFKYWIALTDCDGFRIDTVKHFSLE